MIKTITAYASTARDLLRAVAEFPETTRMVSALAKECLKTRDDIQEARELLSGLSSALGFGLGGENESLPSVISRVEDGIIHNLSVWDSIRSELMKERDTQSEQLYGFLRELGWKKPELPKPGEIRQKIDELFEELAVEKHVGELQWDWAKERIAQLNIDNDSLGGALSMEHGIAVEASIELDTLRVKLRDYEAAHDAQVDLCVEKSGQAEQLRQLITKTEKWHDVTNGIGELPPDGKVVLWQCHTWGDRYYVSIPNSRISRWRFLSSEDVTR